jgi:integrase
MSDNGFIELTLDDLLTELQRLPGVPRQRRRYHRSAVLRVAKLLRRKPNQIPLVVSVIREELKRVNPVALGITRKTFSNIKWAFRDAVAVSNLVPGVVRGGHRLPLSEGWATFHAALPDRRSRHGLSRVIHFGNRLGIQPDQVADPILQMMFADMLENSMREDPFRAYRETALIWNKIAIRFPDLGIGQLTVPETRANYTRIPWPEFTKSLQVDAKACLEWFGGANGFDQGAREQPLSEGRIRTVRGYLHASATALVESGTDISKITGTCDLVTPSNFRKILETRLELVGQRQNRYNCELAIFLVQVAREWVKVSPEQLSQLEWLKSRLPPVKAQMTARNCMLLRQFDDPKVVERLVLFPKRLWKQVRQDRPVTSWTLAKAQAALAIGLLSYIPLRIANLVSLSFETHLNLQTTRGAVSTLEIGSEETKNGAPLAFDIPAHLAQMLDEYRFDIAPPVLGHVPALVFINCSGERKAIPTVRYLISTYLRREVGITMNPHLFRHFAGRLILEEAPGALQIAADLLGHTDLETTRKIYTGIRTRHAGRHHQRLLESAVAEIRGTQKKMGSARRRRHRERRGLE